MTGFLEALASDGGSAVLPYDRRGQRLARLTIPQDRRFPLVRDTHCGDIARTSADLGEHGLHRSTLRGPNLLGVVLHPAGLREVLRKFLLRTGDNATAMVEEYGP